LECRRCGASRRNRLQRNTIGGVRTFARLQQYGENPYTPTACNGHRKIVVQTGRYRGGGANPFILPFRVRCLPLSNASRKMPNFFQKLEAQTSSLTPRFRRCRRILTKSGAHREAFACHSPESLRGSAKLQFGWNLILGNVKKLAALYTSLPNPRNSGDDFSDSLATTMTRVNGRTSAVMHVKQAS
jgi:hypothetical protein